MVKTNTTKLTLTILLSSILAAVLLLVTPLFFYNSYSYGVFPIWGFNAILGLGAGESLGGITTDYRFTWVLYIALLLFVVLGFTTYYIARKAKGYYIFSAIVYVVLAIIAFNSKAWVVKEALGTSAMHGTSLGIGAWFAGLVAALNAVLCVIEFKTFKLR